MTEDYYVSEELHEIEFEGTTFKIRELTARDFAYLQDVSNVVDLNTGEVRFKPGTFNFELLRLVIVEPKLDIERLKATFVRDLSYEIQELLGLTQNVDFLNKS